MTEGALLADTMTQAIGQAAMLPLVSHALLETWRRRRGNTLTLSGFQAAGGLDGGLAHTAEAVWGMLDAAQQPHPARRTRRRRPSRRRRRYGRPPAPAGSAPR